MNSVLTFVERLNFAHPKTLMGSYFDEIIMVLAVVFGLSLILFAWKHHRFYLGVIGIVMGSWGGLLLKGMASAEGGIAPIFFIIASSMLGLFIAVYFEKLMGILLGGVTAACVAYVFTDYIATGENRTIVVSVIFLFGGGLGAISPKIFFVINFALVGSIFVTYGITPAVRGLGIAGADSIIHLLVFLPLFLFGIVYQLMTVEDEKEKGKEKGAGKPGEKSEGKSPKAATAS